MGKPAEILDTTTIQRNDAIRFASLTLDNLEFIEGAWRTGQHRAGRPVHLVTQAVNSLLGLAVFTCEREYVRFTLKERLAALAADGWPAWAVTLGGSPNATLGELVYHLRNAAAHARIGFSSDSSVPSEVQVTFEDAYPKTKQVYWRASISAADLIRFCHRFAKHVDDVIG